MGCTTKIGAERRLPSAGRAYIQIRQAHLVACPTIWNKSSKNFHENERLFHIPVVTPSWDVCVPNPAQLVPFALHPRGIDQFLDNYIYSNVFDVWGMDPAAREQHLPVVCSKRAYARYVAVASGSQEEQEEAAYGATFGGGGGGGCDFFG